MQVSKDASHKTRMNIRNAPLELNTLARPCGLSAAGLPGPDTECRSELPRLRVPLALAWLATPAMPVFTDGDRPITR
jgi:hypothetical protein